MKAGLTMEEARVLYAVLRNTWIPAGPEGKVFLAALKKLRETQDKPRE